LYRREVDRIPVVQRVEERVVEDVTEEEPGLVDFPAVRFDCAGINHQAWITRFEHAGTDLLPRIRELALDPDLWRADTSRMEYVKHFGYPITEAAGHNSEYSPWFRKSDSMVERYCPGGGWNGAPGFIKQLYDRPDWRDTMEKMATGEIPVSLDRSVEYGSQIVSAIAGGEPEVIYGNVMNDGLVDNLPGDACVEVACDVDGAGIHPRTFGALPAHLAAINTNQTAVQRLAVKAALEEDSEAVFQAMCLDPLTAAILTLDEIREMTAELMEAHSQWLPDGFLARPLERKPLLYQA